VLSWKWCLSLLKGLSCLFYEWIWDPEECLKASGSGGGSVLNKLPVVLRFFGGSQGFVQNCFFKLFGVCFGASLVLSPLLRLLCFPQMYIFCLLFTGSVFLLQCCVITCLRQECLLSYLVF